MESQVHKSPTSKFLEVSCPRCRNRMILFGKASVRVKCEKCNYLLTRNKGGKVKVRAKIEKVL